MESFGPPRAVVQRAADDLVTGRCRIRWLDEADDRTAGSEVVTQATLFDDAIEEFPSLGGVHAPVDGSADEAEADAGSEARHAAALAREDGASGAGPDEADYGDPERREEHDG